MTEPKGLRRAAREFVHDEPAGGVTVSGAAAGWVGISVAGSEPRDLAAWPRAATVGEIPRDADELHHGELF